MQNDSNSTGLTPRSANDESFLDTYLWVVIVVPSVLLCFLLVCCARRRRPENKEEDPVPLLLQSAEPSVDHEGGVPEDPAPSLEAGEKQTPPKSPASSDEVVESIDLSIQRLLRSREAGEDFSPRGRMCGSPLLTHTDATGTLNALDADACFALQGDWITSSGLRVNVSYSFVKGIDGSLGKLMKDEKSLVLISNGCVTHTCSLPSGPAPEVLEWGDNMLWVRESRGMSVTTSEPRNSPNSLAPGMRVETPRGRGTLVNLHNFVDDLVYWYVRMDSTPHKVSLVSSFRIKVLPWFTQDSVLRMEPTGQSSFLKLEEDDVRSILGHEVCCLYGGSFTEERGTKEVRQPRNSTRRRYGLCAA
eukprot:TRINITY_DN3907_c0_g1_i1.p1 TRINITY_DN3907_c0_g1~~TRINITY_DN3907_c0_g1_i1.p1  ORF type:complete len:375 (+),score=28.03 TRINITY_DN3907_c0_g1_i1:48-1127(+)